MKSYSKDAPTWRKLSKILSIVVGYTKDALKYSFFISWWIIVLSFIVMPALAAVVLFLSLLYVYVPIIGLLGVFVYYYVLKNIIEGIEKGRRIHSIRYKAPFNPKYTQTDYWMVFLIPSKYLPEGDFDIVLHSRIEEERRDYNYMNSWYCKIQESPNTIIYLGSFMVYGSIILTLAHVAISLMRWF